jgi:hypothetical protein
VLSSILRPALDFIKQKRSIVSEVYSTSLFFLFTFYKTLWTPILPWRSLLTNIFCTLLSVLSSVKFLFLSSCYISRAETLYRTILLMKPMILMSTTRYQLLFRSTIHCHKIHWYLCTKCPTYPNYSLIMPKAIRLYLRQAVCDTTAWTLFSIAAVSCVRIAFRISQSEDQSALTISALSNILPNVS